MSYKNIKPSEFNENIFNLIGKDWFLMTAESLGVVNPMTVAWATFGILWGKPVVSVAVRPERYTHEIASKADTFSLTVFNKEYRKMLGFCGTKSGRDFNKFKNVIYMYYIVVKHLISKRLDYHLYVRSYVLLH